MAATCEISNIFSNYVSAMYSSEDSTLAPVPPAAAFGADDLVLTLSNPQMSLEGTEKTSWSGEQPQFWSKTQVLDWISYQVEKNKYDASAIDFSRCDMDGATLCNCALEELRLSLGLWGTNSMPSCETSHPALLMSSVGSLSCWRRMAWPSRRP